MITSFFYKKGGTLETGLSRARMLSAIQEKDGLLWVDFENASEFEEDMLVEIFNFHPLAVEDCITDHPQPKVDDYEEYLFLVVHALTMRPVNGTKELGTIELNIFLGPNYVVTFHKEPISGLTQVRDAVQKKTQTLMGSSSDILVHAVLDHLVDSYLPVVHEYDAKIDEIEKNLFRSDPSRERLATLLQIKQDIFTFRRVIAPQRDTLYSLTRNPSPFIKPKHVVYFRDISDHLFRISATTDGLHDHLTSMLEVYFSYISSELNIVMKRLTVLATLSMPAVIIASVYGMNVRLLPGAGHDLGFWGIMLFTAALTVGLYFWMKIKKWM